jgi:outer membrane biosynthesis protein TonB
MRTLLVSMLLIAAPAAAEPARDAPAGSARIDVTELTIGGIGGVDPAVMRRAFDDASAAASRCYDSVKARPARLSATVTLTFRIDDHGAVAKASATGVPSLNSCIATAIKALVFDAPSNGAIEVIVKLSFSPSPTTEPQGGASESLIGTGDISSGFDVILADETNGRVTDGEPTTPTDKDAIRTQVRQNMAKIRHCYAIQLLAKPKLAGSVVVKFRIEPDGKVSASTGSGLREVEECTAQVIEAMAFSRPSTGSAIDVSYPFAFKPGASATGGMRGAPAPVSAVSIGQPSVQGDLDHATVRRYLKRNIQKIQYCHEKQLLNKPRLAGTVHAQFAIGDDGKVVSSTATGVDAAVASCVADLIRQIEFPKPKAGGVVQVNYPFVFSLRGDDKKP